MREIFPLDSGINSDIILSMAKIDELLSTVKHNQTDVRFSHLCRICDYFFGEPRQKKSSHRIYKTPWPGDPRVNIQNDKGRAKTYQVRQVLLAIAKLEDIYGCKK